MDRVDYESLVIQDLLNSHTRGELNITPWYQRRAVWKQSQKAYLINTVLEKKPVPSLYIRHTLDLTQEMSIKEVVDGQQRVRCIIEYKADEFASSHPSHKTPVKFSQLKPAERKRFLLTPLSVGYLVDATDEDVIEIFARINSVAKTLNPQEKRNAERSGLFRDFTLRQAVQRLPFWRTYGVFTDNDISRMAEVQFISDLVMNLCEGLQDFSAKRLDRYYDEHEQALPNAAHIQARLDRAFEALAGTSPDILKGSVFARPQVLFSLILVMDRKKVYDPRIIENCIQRLDERVEAVRSADNPSALTTIEYESFSSGNMHRIKFRKPRNKLITATLRK